MDVDVVGEESVSLVSSDDLSSGLAMVANGECTMENADRGVCERYSIVWLHKEKVIIMQGRRTAIPYSRNTNNN